jgi:drug/metabolite transporter (DMT)-like permease
MNIFSYVILIVSVLAVAIADDCIKKAGGSVHALSGIFVNPWFLLAIGLYLIQVIGFGYLFFMGVKLSSVGIIQTVLYALVVILSGAVIFSESISSLQIIGMVCAVGGVILMNF